MNWFMKIMAWSIAIWGASLLWLEIIRFFVSPLVFGLLIGIVLAYVLGQYLGQRDRSPQAQFSTFSSGPTRPAPALRNENDNAGPTRPSSIIAVHDPANRPTRPVAATQ